ncbi:hypothetical protein JP75_20985 [Devosia riboflavina]|uniref:Uncharacterized protein n=1 Tax=Devosia riboflavina TaxID=46914 RepID=A0A087LXT0_9HYPH|nr:hypothetical protein [Devosia riboflavina]KFL29433.1 hypothetical protein JP75_20985 [Devosia riboflavina]
MTDDDLTYEELETLARFGSLDQPTDVDPQHFAKPLSLALIEQKEGGPALTTAGREHLTRKEDRGRLLR